MSNWTLTQISDLAISYAGGTPNRSNPEYFNGNIPWVSSGEVNQASISNTAETITETGLTYSSAKWVPKDSILVAMYGATAGQVSYLNIRATTNQAVLALLPIKGKVDAKFLYYLVNFNKDKILYFAQGSGQPNLNKKIIDTTKVNVPEYAIQQKIAKILSTIDGQIEKTEAIITKYQAVKQGMLQDLFTSGIDVATGELRPKYEDAPELYKDSVLGMIPMEWEVMRLEHVCDMRSGDGITSQRIKPVAEYPVYGGNGLRGYTDEYTHEGYYVLIGRQGALCGNITRVHGKFFASEHAVVVTLKDGIDTDWIGEKLELMNLNQYSEASAQPGLSVSKIQRLLIAKPQLGEQTLAAEKLNQVIAKLRVEEEYLAKTKSLKQGLMGDLLSGKVEVKVDVIEQVYA